VVDALCRHDGVVRVNYPGLPSHPGHAIAASQQSGFGAMVSFEVVGGIAGVERLRGGARVFYAGRVAWRRRELNCPPGDDDAFVDGRGGPRRGGYRDSLVRVSVGIESAEDLVADLNRALDAVVADCTESASPGERLEDARLDDVDDAEYART